jgi:hypothetical protein
MQRKTNRAHNQLINLRRESIHAVRYGIAGRQAMQT